MYCFHHPPSQKPGGHVGYPLSTPTVNQPLEFSPPKSFKFLLYLPFWKTLIYSSLDDFL